MPLTQQKRVFLWTLVGVSLAYFLAITGYIVYFGLHDRIHSADAIVILGNKVEDDRTPSDRLKARLDTGVALFKAGYAERIVVSGGIDPLGHDEALVMKKYLLAQSVPASSIDVDSGGVTTLATAQHLVQLPIRSAIVVSQYFHLARSTAAVRSCGLPEVYHAHAPYFELRDVYSIFREFFAWHQYVIQGCS